MKRNRILCLALALVMLFLLLPGCSASSSKTASSIAQSADGSAPNYGKAKTEGAAGVVPAPSAAPTSGTGSSVLSKAKLIKTANIAMETMTFNTAQADLEKLTEQLGGYFEQSSISTYSSGYRHGNFVIRLPADNFETFYDQVGELSHITSKNKSATDIGEEYYDIEARLTTQKTKLTRLLALLEKADKMEDIISLETAISDTELQIEYLTGSLRKYDSLVGYSSVTVQLSEVYRLSNADTAPISFGERIRNAIENGLTNAINGFQSLVIFLTYNLFTILFLLVILAVVLVLLRGGAAESILKNKREKNTPPKRNKFHIPIYTFQGAAA